MIKFIFRLILTMLAVIWINATFAYDNFRTSDERTPEAKQQMYRANLNQRGQYPVRVRFQNNRENTRNFRNYDYTGDNNNTSEDDQGYSQESASGDNYPGSQYDYGQSNPAPVNQKSEIPYNEILCQSGKYECVRIKDGDKWSTLFPDEYQRDLVKRLNRTNMKLRIGSQIAVPNDLQNIGLLDIAPFDQKIENNGKKLIIVNLKRLAFGAYDASGNLVYWGPVSGGRNWCGDIHRPCNTISGVFPIFNREGEKCRSRTFPVNHGGGAPMPYCVYFHSGFALHGSSEVPGYNASHGCVRLYTEDAKWLNEQFVEMPNSENPVGTEVVVKNDESDGEDFQTNASNEQQHNNTSDNTTFERAATE